MPSSRVHINAERIGTFLKEKPGSLRSPRLAYAVKKDGTVVWIGRHHREIQREHSSDVKHWGFLMRVDENVGHFPYSTGYEGFKPVPPSVMDEIEEKVRECGRVKILRQEPLKE